MRTGGAAGVPAKTHHGTSSNHLAYLHPSCAQVQIPRVKPPRVTDAYPETRVPTPACLIHHPRQHRQHQRPDGDPVVYTPMRLWRDVRPYRPPADEMG
jgi:hypothetical protein